MGRLFAGVAALLILSGAALAETKPAAPAADPRPQPVRTIANVKGAIYRAGNGNWWSLFVVTPKGIILMDPISPDFASWLKGQLAERYPGVPVRYVIYSHSHWDHIE